MKTTKYFLFTLILITVSCKSFIDVEPPKNQMLTSVVFNNDETANAALLGIYSKMVTDAMSYYIPLACGYASDELINHSTSAPLVDLYYNNPRATDAFTNILWSNGFFYIYQANSVIEGCEGSNAIHPDVKKQIMAEAYFIRSFWLYYLLSFFGDIPLTLSTDYNYNSTLRRSPISDVYKQIISDLIYASENLNSKYVDGSSIATTNERVRPNQSAARALLARIHLTLGNWNEAEQFAELVINNNELYDTVSLDQVFIKNNKEAIWQLQQPVPRTSDISTWEGNNFILVSAPNTWTLNCSTLSPWLVDSFEQGDLRKSSWIGEYIDNSVTPKNYFLFPNKYKIRSSSTISEQSTVLRIAEQYLIRAEAKAHKNDINGALQDINLIRKRGGIKPILTIDNESIFDVILKARQIEFFTEWGHRWLDLKRMGYTNNVMPNVLSTKQGGEWDSTKELWPIPQSEIDRNTKLIQNIGYN